jgi:hypothetical protein
MKQNDFTYQVRYRWAMSNKPMSKVFSTYQEAFDAMRAVIDEMMRTWATPDPDGVYIESYRPHK